MALTADEQKLLDELTAKAAEPGADDDYEIEIFSGDKGARIPFSQGAKWLADNFGIGLPDPGQGQGQDQGQGQQQQGGGKRAGQRQGQSQQQQGGGQQQPPARQGYFSKRAAG